MTFYMCNTLSPYSVTPVLINNESMRWPPPSCGPVIMLTIMKHTIHLYNMALKMNATNTINPSEPSLAAIGSRTAGSGFN